MEKFALIVAGGVGARMGAGIPKQFINISGKPILFWTIERFIQFDPSIHLILVLPENQIQTWEVLCGQFNFNHDVTVVPGGKTRFQSVKNGLQVIEGNGIVFIHDGVRPFVSGKTLQNCFQIAMARGNALPVATLVESLRKVQGETSMHVDRSEFRLVQTPQTFQLDMIKKAYEQQELEIFTDDASVCEYAGISINLVDGNPENMKITNPLDLRVAEALLQTGNFS